MQNRKKQTKAPPPVVVSAPSAPRQARRRNRGRRNTDTSLDGAVRSALQGAQVPRNEQDHFVNLVNREQNVHARRYLACLIAPERVMSRIPDSFARPTALVRSKMVLDVYANIDTTPNSGRFALSINPSLGGLLTPSQYKVAMVDNSAGWPTNFNNESAYQLDNDGSDPRLDPFVPQLTQLPLASASYSQGPAGVSDVNPFGTSPVSEDGYGLDDNIIYQPSVEIGGVVMGGGFCPPPGCYRYSIAVGTGAAADATITVHPFNGAVIASDQTTNSAANDVSTTSGYLSIPNSPAATMSDGSGISVGAGIGFTTAGDASGAGYSAFVNFTSTFDDDETLIPTYDQGPTSMYRTVGMSALLTYTGTSLNDGGNLAIAYVPGNTSRTQFFGSGSISGNLTNWSNLAKMKGAYNGKLADGGRAWWAPEDNLDMSMRTPNEALEAVQPTLVIAGQYAPGTGGLSAVIARLEVVTVYEILTESLLWESTYLPGSQACVDLVSRRLAGEPHVMQNKTHNDWIDGVLGSVNRATNTARRASHGIGGLMDGISSLGSLLA